MSSITICGEVSEEVRQQVGSFFDNLKQTVLEQAAHGATIEIKINPKFRTIYDESGSEGYGPAVPLDAILVGQKWTISIPHLAPIPPKPNAVVDAPSLT